MPDTVLNALKNKLERYEADGEADRVKRVKARIAELESAPAKAPALPMTLSPTQVVTTTTTVKPAAQKVTAPKKAAARKKK